MISLVLVKIHWVTSFKFIIFTLTCHILHVVHWTHILVTHLVKMSYLIWALRCQLTRRVHSTFKVHIAFIVIISLKRSCHWRSSWFQSWILKQYSGIIFMNVVTVFSKCESILQLGTMHMCYKHALCTSWKSGYMGWVGS